MHSYNSFNNHTCEQTLRKIRETLSFLNSEQEVWDATEKIHGAHFVLIIRGSTVVAARRTGLLKKDENFYGFQPILEELRPKALETFAYVKSEISPEMEQLSIHGELFGGTYPHEDVKPIPFTSRVQKGVWYSPSIHFCAYDLHIRGVGYLDSGLSLDLFKKFGFLYAEPLFSGTFGEALEFSNVFETTWPEKLGYPPIKNNFAEGLVLKPRKTMFFASGKRAMLKSKNPTFSEVASAKKKTKQPKAPRKNGVPGPSQPTDDIDRVWEVLELYVTFNRLQNVESKGYFGKERIRILIKDAMEEFLECHNDKELLFFFQQLPKERQGLVKKRLAEAVLRLCEKHNT